MKILLRRSKKVTKRQESKNALYMMWGTMGEIMAALVGRWKERTRANPDGISVTDNLTPCTGAVKNIKRTVTTGAISICCR